MKSTGPGIYLLDRYFLEIKVDLYFDSQVRFQIIYKYFFSEIQIPSKSNEHSQILHPITQLGFIIFEIVFLCSKSFCHFFHLAILNFEIVLSLQISYIFQMSAERNFYRWIKKDIFKKTVAHSTFSDFGHP